MQKTFLQRLLERGRALSKSNETRIRSAITALQEVLAAIAGGGPMNEAQRTQFNEAGLALLEAELSHDQQRDAVRKALRKAISGGYCYIQEMYDSWLVYNHYDYSSGGDDVEQLYKVSYVIDESTGAVTFGTPVAVMARMVYEPIATMQESAAGDGGELTRLVEAQAPVSLVEGALRRDGTVPIKIIQPGWGSSGYYPAEVLERDGPKVFTRGMHMYWNHATATESIERPERDLSDLAAVLTSDARWDAEGPAGPGLYADVEVKAAYTEAVDDLAADIGVSINTSGRARAGDAEGRTGAIIEALFADPLSSIDFVTKPGAGGQILQIFESAGRRPAPAATPPETPEAPAAEPAIETTTTQEAIDVTEQEAQALRESQAQVQTENARLREALLLREARDVVATALAGRTDLLEATKTRIANQLSANVAGIPRKDDGALDQDAYKAKIEEAVKTELDYLTSITGGGEITGMGGTGAGAGATEQVDLSAVEAKLQDAFASIGLSESAAKIATSGR